MKFSMKLKKQYFDMIKNGEKTYEIRLYDEKRQQISLGDTIEFSLDNGLEKIECVVKETLFAPNFKTLLNFLPIKKVGFESVEKALETCYQIYTKEQEKEFGVIAINIDLKTK